MTDEPVPHQNGVADELAAIAAPPPAPAPSTEPELSPEAPAASAEAASAAPETPETPAEPPPPSFDDLGLHPDVKLALDEMGYLLPTPVQTAVYRPVSEGKDLLVQSRTGTGKTTAFGLPTISKIIPTHRAPQALVLAPTRELALQVSRELTQLGKHRGILVEPIYGGAPIGKQIRALRDGVHIVVGTPGRVLDHIGRRTLDCSTVQTFILDECDEMLSMGFLEDIERVVSYLPDRRQTLLFSATMPDEVLRYARRHMRSPEQISLSRDGISVNEIHHAYYIVSGIARSRDLLKIIFAENPESAIIFCNMRDETTMVARFLQKQGLDAEPLSSDLAQSDRERVMNRMKQHNLRFLCATDVAARGIDISNLSHVINYSVPETPEIYVHRTGRTGRAGKKGTALSLVGPRELGNFRYVRLQFGIKPEERVLPKDDIFIGRLKVPLPPVGTPQPPDPVQILIRGTPLAHGGPTDLEMKIFEKLMVTQAGKKVVAQLVAERLNQLTTRSKPRRPERSERAERSERPERDREDDAAGAPEERGERGERRFDRDRPERRFDRDREDRGERRFDRERPERGERGERGDRPWRDRDETRRDRPDRGERGDRRDRPERGDRGDRGERSRDRIEMPAETAPPPAAEVLPEAEAGAVVATAAAEAAEPTAREGRDRHRDRDRDRDRDRHRRDHGERRFDRDHRDHGEPARQEPHAAAAEPELVEDAIVVGTEAAPPVEAVVETLVETLETVEPVPSRGEDRAALHRGEHRDRAEHRGEHRAEHPDRGDRKGRRDKRSEPTADTREFWETWADEKSARVSEARSAEPAARSKPEPHRAAAVEPAVEAAVEAEAAEPEDREAASDTTDRRSRGRDQGRDQDRGRDGGRDRDGGRGRIETKGHDRERPGKPERDRHDKDRHGKPERQEHPDKADRSTRSKRDTVVTPAPVAAADGAQARLFVNLGKKHGVSADDLRELLAGPLGGDKSRIGSVSLRDSHAHVRVPEECVDTIIAGVHGTQHNDQEVTVERARA